VTAFVPFFLRVMLLLNLWRTVWREKNWIVTISIYIFPPTCRVGIQNEEEKKKDPF